MKLKISAQVAAEGAMASFDQHFARRISELEAYARKPGAKQGYIDRQQETINHYHGFKSTLLDYIAALRGEIHLQRVANANLVFYTKILENELKQFIEVDML